MAQFGKRMNHNASIKQMQSEMGVTGEHSPNIPFIDWTIRNIEDQFSIDEYSDLTKHDSVLLVSMMTLGTRYDSKEDGASSIYGLHKGNIENFSAMIYGWLKGDKNMQALFGQIMRRIMEENVLEMLQDNLRKKMGTKKKEDDDTE